MSQQDTVTYFIDNYTNVMTVKIYYIIMQWRSP